MFGDVVPGDITHQDAILQYGNHFKEGFRNLPRNLGMEDKKYEEWQMGADIMMVSIFYEQVITYIYNILYMYI